MKPRLIFIFVIAMALLFALPYPARAVDADLEGLRVIKILVEGLDKGAENVHITRQMLEDQVLVTLRSKAPNLRITTLAWSFLYVNLSLLATGPDYAGHLALSLSRPVDVLIGDDMLGQKPTPLKRKWTLAAVWDTGGTFTGGSDTIVEQTRSMLDRLLEQFLAAYYRSNNK